MVAEVEDDGISSQPIPHPPTKTPFLTSLVLPQIMTAHKTALLPPVNDPASDVLDPSAPTLTPTHPYALTASNRIPNGAAVSGRAYARGDSRAHMIHVAAARNQKSSRANMRVIWRRRNERGREGAVSGEIGNEDMYILVSLFLALSFYGWEEKEGGESTLGGTRIGQQLTAVRWSRQQTPRCGH